MGSGRPGRWSPWARGWRLRPGTRTPPRPGGRRGRRGAATGSWRSEGDARGLTPNGTRHRGVPASALTTNLDGVEHELDVGRVVEQAVWHGRGERFAFHPAPDRRGVSGARGRHAVLRRRD